MEKRTKERNAPKYWNADELRNGLWKTEKALADLEIQQYNRHQPQAPLRRWPPGQHSPVAATVRLLARGSGLAAIAIAIAIWRMAIRHALCHLPHRQSAELLAHGPRK
jgi:hypothetical protein